jgi:hypothetical protein
MKVIALCRGCGPKRKKHICEGVVCVPGTAVYCECQKCHPTASPTSPLVASLAELRIRLATTLELLDVALEQATHTKDPKIGGYGKTIHFKLTSCGAGPGRRLVTSNAAEVTCRSCLHQLEQARDLVNRMKPEV